MNYIQQHFKIRWIRLFLHLMYSENIVQLSRNISPFGHDMTSLSVIMLSFYFCMYSQSAGCCQARTKTHPNFVILIAFLAFVVDSMLITVIGKTNIYIYTCLSVCIPDHPQASTSSICWQTKKLQHKLFPKQMVKILVFRKSLLKREILLLRHPFCIESTLRNYALSLLINIVLF